MAAITLAKDFDSSSSAICFSNLRKGKMGNKTVYLNGAGNKKLTIQTPFMKAPFGLSSYTDESSGRTSYSLSLSFDKNEESHMQIQQVFEQLDNTIVEHVEKNSKELLGKKYNSAVMREALYKPVVNPGKEDYGATMKIKVMNYNGQFQAELYNSKREKIDMENLTKGAQVACIFEIASIWFIDNKFGVSIRLQQAMTKVVEKLPPCAFIGMSDDEDDESDELELEDEEAEILDESEI